MILDSNFTIWERYLNYPEENRMPYAAVYYNPVNRQYFFATIRETNADTLPANTRRKIASARDARNYEKPFHNTFMEYALIYVDDLGRNSRVFTYGTNTNKVYIKTLVPLRDTNYIDNGNNSFRHTQPVYPVTSTLFVTQYTNAQGSLFNRVLDKGGVLRLVGPVNPSKIIP